MPRTAPLCLLLACAFAAACDGAPDARPDGAAAETPAPATAAAPAAPQAGAASSAPSTGRETIAGVDYYYEIHGGSGEPLLLLHGGLGTADMFDPILPQLAAGRRVIAVDLQGHGRTPLGDRAFSPEAMGDDMATLVRRLGHERVDVLGYSLGGGVGLRMAIQHPQRVRRLALVSTPFSDAGFYPGIRAQQKAIDGKAAPMMRDTPMYASYAAVAPDAAEFPRLLDTLGAYMRRTYDWSGELKALTMPVMLVYGDGDMFRPEHVVAFYQALGGGLQDAGWRRETLPKHRLAILPDLTHYDIFLSPRLADTVRPFLDGTREVRSWAR